MGRVAVANWVTLDGVMQAPGAADEDRRDDFAHGGWAAPYSDALVGEKVGALIGIRPAWLFGRTTYEGLLTSWNRLGGPFEGPRSDGQLIDTPSRNPPVRSAQAHLGVEIAARVDIATGASVHDRERLRGRGGSNESALA